MTAADTRKALVDQAEEVLSLFKLPTDPTRNVAIAVVNKLFPEVLQEELASYQGGMECPVCGSTEPHNAHESDPVNHPAHYTAHPSGVECITVTEWMGFNLGNAVKYIWRADEKGDAIQDLEKAKWYLERELQRRKKTQS